MSSRARILAIVSICAVAAGTTAGVVAWAGRGETSPPAAAQTGPRAGAPPMALDVLIEDESEAAELQRASKLYQDGRRAPARQAFEQVLAADPGSLYAAVGAAMSRWPEGALPALRELAREHPESGLVKLHEGLVLFWLRRDGQAEAAWRRVDEIDPDSPAAVRAESLLHPDMPQGRPFFVPSAAVPDAIAGLAPLAQLRALEARAEEERTAEAWILYGVALQRAGRPVSAVEAFDRAAALDEGSAEALAAAAVARFDKDDPSQAFSRLGPLAERFPDAAVVRFHLGLCLLWLSQVEEARTQLEAAVRDGRGTIYASQAELLLERLDEATGAGAATTG